MSLFTVDSNNVFGMSIQEAGTYNVKITRSVMTTTKGRGLPMLTLDFEAIDGPYKGGQIRYQNLVWDTEDDHKTELSIKRFNTLCVAIGLPDGAAVDSLQQMAQGLQGKSLSVDAEWGDPNSNGQVYLEVQGYHPLDPKGSQPNGVKRPNSGSNTTSKHPVGATSAPQSDPFGKSNDSINITDDDLPF